ncbi:MAG TPA: hypothetical protein VFD70_16700 [Anaerolineae bacterium]|nr:hypothetical protein [Anaerolineae bacterium]
MNNFVIVRLPAELCERVQKKFAGIGFESLDALLEFVLRELAQDDAMQMDRDEERIIEERLKDLGYVE